MTTNDELPQEDLEKMISEAELEAQIEEESEDTDIPEETNVEETPEDPPKPGLSKGRKLWRRTLLWLVVLAIAFAGGFFFDSWMRYVPQRELVKALNEDLVEMESTVQELEDEIERLSEFEAINITQAEEIKSATTHLTLLSARTAVADASLAIEQNRTADAKLVLDKLGNTLETLKGLLSADQAEVVDNMIQRHELIMIELEGDGNTVLTDLEVLSSRLNTLEVNLFAAP